jgi:aminomethyltransferase
MSGTIVNWINESTGTQVTRRGPRLVPEHFGSPSEEYEAAIRSAGLHDRSYRGLIEIGGCDRAAWLHNFVTNTVKTLQPGDGNYAFALNTKGRVVFDCNMLVHPETIWLDVERSHVAAAMTHLGRYIITEDVTLTDLSDQFVRLALLGPKAADVLAGLGASSAPAMAQLQHAALPMAGKHRPFMRHDFAGVFGAELWVEAVDADQCWSHLLDIGRHADLRPVGLAAVETLRIEAGIPWLGKDIDEDVLPAETLQIERGISYVKGCYLGQEIVERMRSRGSLARQLSGLRIEGDVRPDLPASIRIGGGDAGRVTSICQSPHVGAIIGLGYVRSAMSEAGTPVTIATRAGTFPAALAALPFRRG